MSASTAPPPLTARHATLQDLTGLLRGQHARKVDVTAPAALIRSAGGNLVLDGTVPQLTPDGVTMTAGSYRPTEVFDEGIAGKLGVPAAYLRKMRDAGAAGLYDANPTGCGAWSLPPRLVARVCGNGMTITRDAARIVHRGDRQEPGVTWHWSADTGQKELALLTARVRDTVTNFLSAGYVERAVRDMEAQAGHKVEPVTAIQHVAARLRYTQAQQEEILAHFIAGGAVTAGGIMHAVTSAAQVQPDGDTASHLEDTALQAFELAAAL
jgi:hypothetical protein